MIDVAMALESVIFIKLKSLHNGIEDSMSGNKSNLEKAPGREAKKETDS